MKHRYTTLLAASTLAIVLSACSKTTEPVGSPTDEPIVSGTVIRFAPNSAAARQLQTQRVVESQDNILSLPARITWDEDHTSRVSPAVAGRLTDILVQPGQVVHTGQPLAKFNSPELGSAQAESTRAQADLAQAQRNLSRIQLLAASGIVAGKDLEQAQADMERASADATRTGLRLKSLGASSTVNQDFVLRSPINGIVVERNTNPGMEWRPDQAASPLFIVSDPGHLWCWIDAPEAMLSTLHHGAKVTLHASAWPQSSFEAKIDYVADALDPVSRTLKVRARVNNPRHILKGEMYVTAELSGQSKGALDIPAQAVFLNDGQQQVFVRTAAGEFTRKTITPVATNEHWISITQGLNKGDEVVADGALYLQKILNEASSK